MIQESIERSFFEAIRLLLVAEGYTPNIADAASYPNTEAGYEAYLAALAAIANGVKGFATEVFSTSNPQDKGTLNLPRISLNTSAFLPGVTGYDSSAQPVWNSETNKFELFNYDSRTYMLFLDCMVSAKTQTQLRILMDIVHRALPQMGYLKYYDNTELFFIELSSFQEQNDATGGILEYNYRYEVPDIQWVAPIKQTEGGSPIEIAPITQITLNTYINDRLGITKIIN